MQITYANKRVERYFTDFAEMKKKINPEWVRTIKKFIDHLIAADNFGIFMSLGLLSFKPSSDDNVLSPDNLGAF